MPNEEGKLRWAPGAASAAARGRGGACLVARVLKSVGCDGHDAHGAGRPARAQLRDHLHAALREDDTIITSNNLYNNP